MSRFCDDRHKNETDNRQHLRIFAICGYLSYWEIRG